tara:strand:- start:7768 stop:8463 length:696 start_codon:yes stop_codon:yes gene_type:complete
MKPFDLLEERRKHVRVYKKNPIPPKEQIEDALWKAWKTTPSKNSAMAYTVYVYGPNSQNYKDICHQMCHRNHIKAEMKAVQEGLQDMTQGGKLNPDYAHIANAPWLFGVHSRVLKQMNPYYQRQEKQGHFADQRYEKRVNTIVDSVAVEVGLFIQNLTNYLLEYNIDVSYTSCFPRDPKIWQIAGMPFVKYRPITLMSAGYGEVYRRQVLSTQNRSHEDYKPDIKEVIEWK